MKGAVSSSGASVSGSIGRQEGSVGVGANGSVSLGIDYAGVKLGVTNDYGGAGTIGFGGQSITWGITGGNIKLGIGGFDVEVQARDCVVVETKRIAGMIVATRTYPDPGCKEPIEKLKDPAKGSANPQIDLGNFATEAICKNGKWQLKQVVYLSKDPEWWIQYTELWELMKWLEQARREFHATIFNPWGYGAWWPSTTKDNYEGMIASDGGLIAANAANADYWLGRNQWKLGDTVTSITPIYKALAWYWGGYASTPVLPAVSYYYTSTRQRYISTMGSTANVLGAPSINNTRLIITNILPPPPCPNGESSNPNNLLIINNLPLAGNQPPMPESCCESLKADIEDIKSVLATKEMLAKKLTFPWRLRMPGGEGDEVITDYPNLARCIAQMIDHLGIHPPKLSIKDINNAIAGDQSISNQFPSATQGFEALMAQVWDANADVDTLTNFLYRLSWLCVQQSMNLAVVSSDIQCIKDMVGGKTKPDTAILVTPFNIGAGVNESNTKGKGFGKGSGGGIDKKIDVNTELSTESLLPDFLKIRENPVVIETFDGDKDVIDMLSMLTLKVETLLAR